jgi:hypothetical protein
MESAGAIEEGAIKPAAEVVNELINDAIASLRHNHKRISKL